MPSEQLLPERGSDGSSALEPQLRSLKVINSLGSRFGGPSTSCANASIAEQRAGIANTVVFVESGSAANVSLPARMALEREGVTMREFPLTRLFGRGTSRWGFSLRMSWWLVRNHRHYDIIHVHNVWGLGAMTIASLRPFGTWLMAITPHETLTRFDLESSSSWVTKCAKKALRRLYERRCDLVVFSSAIERRDSTVPASVCQVVIPHAVADERRIAEVPSTAPRAGIRIGFLGRFHPKKNLDIIVRALADLPADVILMVAGGGSPSDELALRQLIATQQLTSRVELLGFLGPEEKQRFFLDIDLLVMPSDYECFGMVAAEALAAGVPAIVGPNTGIASLIAETDAGAVVPATLADLSAALIQFSTNQELRSAWRANTRKDAAQRLTFEQYGRSIVDSYGLFTPA